MKNKIVTVLFGVCVLFFILTFSIGLPIYNRWFYFLHVKNMDLDFLSDYYGISYSYDMIVEAYNELLNYLTLPFFEFGTGKLAYSPEGKAHFVDCKRLFDLNISVLLISGIAISVILVFQKKNKIKFINFKGFPVYFYAGIFALVLPLILGALVSIDVEKAFVVFHKIFFPGKDNWIFDPRYDEIITVFPMEFFINCAAFIGVGLLVISIALILLGIYQKHKNKN